MDKLFLRAFITAIMMLIAWVFLGLVVLAVFVTPWWSLAWLPAFCAYYFLQNRAAGDW